MILRTCFCWSPVPTNLLLSANTFDQSETGGRVSHLGILVHIRTPPEKVQCLGTFDGLNDGVQF